MNAKANYGLLGNYGVSTEVYHVMKYTLVRMVLMGAVRIWAQRAREISVPSFQTCWQPKSLIMKFLVRQTNK